MHLRLPHPVTADDLDLLAQMNRQLIEDEKSVNPMDLNQLRERMRGWLAADYHAVLFEQAGKTVGYTLYRFQGEAFDGKPVVYVRQFFITRAFRGQGLGRKAFEKLAQTHLEGAHVTLEVLAANPNGLAFWERLGFKRYAVTLQR